MNHALRAQSVRRIFEKGGRGSRKFRKFENNEHQNENFLQPESVRLPAQNKVKNKKKRSSLKFSPVFDPKLGAAQKQKVFAHRLCAQTFGPSYKGEGGACHNFAYYSMLIILSWRPKGWGHGPMPIPKYAPVQPHQHRMLVWVQFATTTERLLDFNEKLALFFPQTQRRIASFGTEPEVRKLLTINPTFCHVTNAAAKVEQLAFFIPIRCCSIYTEI